MDYSKINIYLKIEQVDPADLLLPENLQSLKYTAYNLIEYLDWDGASVFATELKRKLSQISPKDLNEKNGLRVLSFWLLRLKLFSYGNLKSNEKSELFKENFVEALQEGLDIKKSVIRYLDIYDSPKIIFEETSYLASLLNSSPELLGDTYAFSAGEFKQTVANWIKEYQPMVKVASEMQQSPGTFHIIKFMDSNKYVKLLSAEERDVLKELLDFYNFLLSPITYIDVKSAEADSAPSIPYMSSQRMTMPSVVQGGSKISANQLQPKTGAPSISPPAKHLNIQEIMNKKPGNVVAPVKKAPSKPFSMPQGSGISFGSSSSAAADTEDLREETKKQETAKIDQKLQELKKRVEK
jgi:hypothetical protein